jgi:hypothetical protein
VVLAPQKHTGAFYYKIIQRHYLVLSSRPTLIGLIAYSLKMGLREVGLRMWWIILMMMTVMVIIIMIKHDVGNY